MKLEYKDYPLTYNGCLLEYNDILSNEDNSIYLRIPGSFTDIKLQPTNYYTFDLGLVYYRWSLNELFYYTKTKNPNLGDIVSELRPSPGSLLTYRYVTVGCVSDPKAVVVPQITVNLNNLSETINFEMCLDTQQIKAITYSKWYNEHEEKFVYTPENVLISPGQTVYELPTLSLDSNVVEYGTVVSYIPKTINN